MNVAPGVLLQVETAYHIFIGLTGEQSNYSQITKLYKKQLQLNVFTLNANKIFWWLTEIILIYLVSFGL